MLPSTIFRSEEINFTLAFIFFPSNRYRNADSFLWISERTVRVKGGMSLRNGMWHGLRNDIIMRNLIYAAE